MRQASVHIIAAVVLASLPLFSAWGAEVESGGKSEVKPQTQTPSDTEARLKALEQRVKDLQQQLAERNAPAPLPPAHMRQFGQREQNMDQMWESFRHQLEDQLHMNIPNIPNMPNMPAMPNVGPGPQGMFPEVGQRPRLGVELAPPSEALNRRFKNDVSEGAVVKGIVPGSPAEEAGFKPGDVITAIGGKKIKSPQEAIEAVRNAPAGKTEVTVSRQGELMNLAVNLGKSEPESQATTAPQGMISSGGWLRAQPGGSNVRSQTEVKASALELSDKLAKELKLTDEQRKKMSEVLAKESNALSVEIAAKSETHENDGTGYTLDMSANVNQLVRQHADQAAKELAGVLSPEQLKQWSDYRKANNSVSVSHSMELERSGPPSSGPPNNF